MKTLLMEGVRDGKVVLGIEFGDARQLAIDEADRFYRSGRFDETRVVDAHGNTVHRNFVKGGRTK